VDSVDVLRFDDARELEIEETLLLDDNGSVLLEDELIVVPPEEALESVLLDDEL
jgi:hypothetical protein